MWVDFFSMIFDYVKFMNNRTKVISEKIINIIKQLDQDYSEFIKNEGKWLHGGFKSVFHTEKLPFIGFPEDLIKTEVFMMLPNEIRQQIRKYLIEKPLS